MIVFRLLRNDRWLKVYDRKWQYTLILRFLVFKIMNQCQGPIGAQLLTANQRREWKSSKRKVKCHDIWKISSLPPKYFFKLFEMSSKDNLPSSSLSRHWKFEMKNSDQNWKTQKHFQTDACWMALWTNHITPVLLRSELHLSDAQTLPPKTSIWKFPIFLRPFFTLKSFETFSFSRAGAALVALI